MKNIFRGLMVALFALSLPLLGQTQLSTTASGYDSQPVTFSKKAGDSGLLLVEGKNLREIVISEAAGGKIFTWKAKKKGYYNQISLDVSDLTKGQSYLVTVRYGTQYYSRLMRFDDAALQLSK